MGGLISIKGVAGGCLESGEKDVGVILREI